MEQFGERLYEFKKILENTPITASFIQQVEQLINRYGDEYVGLAEKILRLLEKMGYDSSFISMSYSYDYLKQLDYFIKNGDYGHKDYNEVKEAIYDNKEVMLDTYMPGLLSAYAYTSILYEKYHLFLNSFISVLQPGMKGIEIGFGEGFYLWELYNHIPDLHIKAFDISIHAIEFATKVLSTLESEKVDCKLYHGNVIEGLEVESNSMEFGVMAELIEHLPEPHKAIEEMARILCAGGILYVTTVKDSNHMDHMTNFESTGQVINLLQNAGFEILEKSIYRIQDDNPSTKDNSVGMAFIARLL